MLNLLKAMRRSTQTEASLRKRKILLGLLGAGIVVLAAAYGAYYFTVGVFMRRPTTAYVSGNLIQLTPQVSGTVVAVNADDTQIVKKGDPVVTLDPADSKVRWKTPKRAGSDVRQVSGLYVNNSFYAANVAQRQADLLKQPKTSSVVNPCEYRCRIWRRRVSRSRCGACCQAALDAVKQQAVANHVLTDRTSIERHPDVLAAATRVRDAYLNYARNTLPAPVTGYVSQRSVQVGQRVGPGTPLMTIVPLNGVWVDANFKEVQLRHIRIGQPVTLTADAYGSSVKYHGRVVGFSAGTGAAFATLPAQNATGNWIKVVQRLPVRVALDPGNSISTPCASACRWWSTSRRGWVGHSTGSGKEYGYQTDVFAQYGAQGEPGDCEDR